MASTANQRLFDASLRHQIAVRRYATTEAEDIVKLLEQADRELTVKIRDRLAKLSGKVDFTSERWKTLLKEVKKARKATMSELKRRTTEDMHDFARVEVGAETEIIKGAIGIEHSFASVDMQQLRSIVTTKPFAGTPLSGWFDSLAAGDVAGLTRGLQMGMVQGESIPDIMKRVAGSVEHSFRDGALAATRRKTEAVVRTAVNHVSNEARGAVWDANSDIISTLRWTATLDGRTTPICMARDGKMAALPGHDIPDSVGAGEVLLPQNARPPAHVNCRSVMVAVIDGVGLLGDRPYVRDTRRREEREVDFRAEAKRTGRPIAEIRKEWADANIGQVPAKTTYNDWLKTQPEDFQDEILGRERAEIFRQGKADVDQFVDKSGRRLSLKELEEKYGIKKVQKWPKPDDVVKNLPAPPVPGKATAADLTKTFEGWAKELQLKMPTIKGSTPEAAQARLDLRAEVTKKIHDAMVLESAEQMEIVPTLSTAWSPADRKIIDDQAKWIASRTSKKIQNTLRTSVIKKPVGYRSNHSLSEINMESLPSGASEAKVEEFRTVLTHEFGHELETFGDMKDAPVRQWLIDRAHAQAPGGGLHITKKYGQYTTDAGRVVDELVWEDKFKDVYVGKVYVRNNHLPSDQWTKSINGPKDLYGTEVTSMGLQWMYKDPVGFLREDPDMFRFVLSFLRGELRT